ncbi:GIP [Symbiodinium necroappetens]|uniref:GIP protein n=1 Tax=Symbiodinium necroappetens TaxID=1628268 RepID=A0A813BVM8_9DINO|nr:GIP [Symbiodinium necroappetens]
MASSRCCRPWTRLSSTTREWRYFYGGARRPDQSLLAYCADHREALREVQKHGIKIPPEVDGYILLRRSGLTNEQKQLIQSQVGADMSASKVEEHMYFLLGSSSGVWRRATGHAHAAEDELGEETWEDEPNYADYAYYEDEAWEADEPTVEEADGDAEQALYEDEPTEEDENLEEAYATYLDARKRLAEVKASRGYYPVVALVPGSEPSSSQLPLSYSNAASKGKGRSAVFALRTVRPLGIAMSFTCQRSLPVRVPNRSCISFECAVSPRVAGDSPPVCVPDRVLHSSVTCLTGAAFAVDSSGPPPLFAQQDGGASAMLGGHRPVMEAIEHLISRGVPESRFEFSRVDKTFRFGGDASGHASWAVHLPVVISRVPGRLQTFIVEGDTPILIGRPAKALQVKTDFERDLCSVLGAEFSAATLGERGEFLLRLDDGLDEDTLLQPLAFDLMTDEIATEMSATAAPSFNTLSEYLADTGRPGPEVAHTVVSNTGAKTGPPQTPILEPKLGVCPGAPDHALGQSVAVDTDFCLPIPAKLFKSLEIAARQAANAENSVIEQALWTSPSTPMVFWELYSGDAGLSQAMEQLGFQVRTFDLPEWDFTKARHRSRLLDLYESERPHVVWLAPPYHKWSPLQELTSRDAGQQELLDIERCRHHASHLRLSRRLFRLQLAAGLVAVIEHPLKSRAWTTPAFSTLGGYQVVIDQCAFGACLPDDKGRLQPIRKPTRLQVTTLALQEAFAPCHCPGHRFHLPVVGFSPRFGSRAAGDYLHAMCCHIAVILQHALLGAVSVSPVGTTSDTAFVQGDGTGPDGDDLGSVPEPAESAAPAAPRHHNSGVLQRLLEERPAEAKRIAARLHKNLGHPSAEQLVHQLRARGASQALVEAAQAHVCPVCAQLAAPAQAPKSALRSASRLNERLLADTMWVTLPCGKTVPVLSMMDAATRYLVARPLHTESSEQFLRALERGWIKLFGAPAALQVDAHPSWCSASVRDWATEHSIELMISPGEAHSRLAQVERRHQVLRRAIDVFLASAPGDGDLDALRQALDFVVPQLNRTVSVQGFSPTQWVLGYQPELPGFLLDERVNPSHLDPSESFRHGLELRALASKALTEADTDERLRRALLRQTRHSKAVFRVGQRVFYYRDGSGVGPRIRWKGRAMVVMIEPDSRTGRQSVVWITHGAQLRRAAPEHLRTDMLDVPLSSESPGQALDSLRGRGTTTYLDLNRVNRRSRDDIVSDDEAEEYELSEPSVQDEAMQPQLSMPPSVAEPGGEPDPVQDQLHPTFASPAAGLETFQQRRARVDRQETISYQPPAAELHPAFTPPRAPETFQEHRARIDRQETISHRVPFYGPTRPVTARTTPYAPDRASASEAAFACDVLPESGVRLPCGWTYNAEGYLSLGAIADQWELSGRHLVRRHFVARSSLFSPSSPGDCPVPVQMLVKGRTTFRGNHRHDDRWRSRSVAEPTGRSDDDQVLWTGRTVFKIQPRFVEEARAAFVAASGGHTTHAAPVRKDNLSERTMGLSDLLSFQEAKRRELSSFFQNSVWEFDTESSAPAGRILKAHFILKWGKHPDGSPRAKARLITQGFKDPDALNGLVDRTSPTLTRLARHCMLSLAATLGWDVSTGDITTAFLQGKPYDGQRTLWIRLPADARKMLGLTDAKARLKDTFAFREWHEGERSVEYLGSQIECLPDGSTKYHQAKYLAKLHPITVDKVRAASPEEPVTEKERTKLRALLGGLQWAATQSTPHLQPHTSMLAGQTTKATVATLVAANKALRFVKANSDVGLCYQYLGPFSDLVLVAYSDASFACRADLSSQGGCLVTLCHKDAMQKGTACAYHVLDWRSFRLPRVARSTLSAEGQAAAEAADALYFTSLFLKAFFEPGLDLASPTAARLEHPSALVVDAKALYNLLVKDELQTALGAEKRTAVEVLVTKQKLREAGATPRWVSSERQLADGLTKESATQLLADRLRTHKNRLTDDLSYEAARKKDPERRQASAQEFALSRPLPPVWRDSAFGDRAV